MRKYERITAYFTFILLIISLLPVMYLGRYNHPTGDDYYFGVEAHQAWDTTGNMGEVLSAAAQGVATQYQTWQGTYSAMFLMYLPPNIFGDGAYHLFTSLILLSLSGSIFYLLRQLLCTWLELPCHVWVTTSSLVSLLCIQTVAYQQESFFWYNGSMYYTGFLSVTFFFFGLLCRYLKKVKWCCFPILLLLAFFLAGGNYVSLLPTMILTVCIAGGLFLRKHFKPAITVSIISIVMLLGFAVSAAAPGNAVRQNDMWKISAYKAVCKSLIHGMVFLKAWMSVWWILAVLILTPILWTNFHKIHFRFNYPLLVIGFAYGVFCSMTCPTYYTMNAVGPARAVAIMYYGFILFTLFCYFYGLGYIHRVVQEKNNKQIYAKYCKIGYITLAVAVFALLIVQTVTNAFAECTTARACRLLLSGEAVAYEEEYQARMALLKDTSKPVVIFQPYEHKVDMLYVGDLEGDPTTRANLRVAQYFNKESVSVNWE